MVILLLAYGTGRNNCCNPTKNSVLASDLKNLEE